MKNGLIICISMLLVVLPTHNAWAVTAAPIVVTLTQLGGSTFEAMPKGDEYASWMETLDGISIVQHRGEWFYAVQGVTGDIVSSGSPVGSLSQADLAQWPLGLSPYVDPETREKNYPIHYRDPSDASRGGGFAQRIVTILVDFQDIQFQYTDVSFQSRVYGASASVKDFFEDNSYASFTVTAATESYDTDDDGIIHVDLSATNHPNLGQGDSTSLASDILTAADSFINFASFDTDGDGAISAQELSIIMILAGYENSFGGGSSLEPRVWAHKTALFPAETYDSVSLAPYTMLGETHSTGSDHQATIGIMCHELGHLMLSLPDLYDLDGSSLGIGDWGLMGGGSWNFTGSFSGDSPSHLCAWSKIVVGMLAGADVDSTTSGVSIAQVETNAVVKRLWADEYKSPIGEHFLVENRQLTGYDAGLPADGLLIWHVDGSAEDNTDETHKMVDLEAADGSTHLDDKINPGDGGDPFPGTENNTTFNNTSTPDSKDYTPASTGIEVTSISASMSTMTANMTAASLSFKGTIWYNENLVNTAWGFDSGTIWTAIEYFNDTTGDTIDGFEVYIRGTSATVDFELFTSLGGGSTPTGSLYPETGFAATNGWNRFMLTTPQSFAASATRVVVLKIVDASDIFPAAADGGPLQDDRSYIDFDGTGAFGAVTTDLSQMLLLSGFEVLDADNVYVDFAWGGTEIGTEPSPFKTLAGALAVVNEPGTIWMDAGSTSVTPTISKNVTLKTTGGTVTIGGP